MATQKLRIKRFSGTGASAVLDASVVVNVNFSFDGLTPQEVMDIASGGSSPRVRYQDFCRTELSRDAFLALDGTTQTVSVRDLYASSGHRKGATVQSLFLRLTEAERTAFLDWAMIQPSPSTPLAS